VFVHDSRSDERDVRQLVEPRDQTINRSGRHDRVWIQQQKELGFGRPNADVVCPRKPDIPGRGDYGNVGEARANEIRRAVGRRVVHDDDLVGNRWRPCHQRIERPQEIFPGVVGYDDNRESRHERAASSSVESTAVAASDQR
jgi:hypothetical protein